MSRKKKKKQDKASVLEAMVSTAIDKVADAAVDKVKEKIPGDVLPEFLGKAVDSALDTAKAAAVSKVKDKLPGGENLPAVTEDKPELSAESVKDAALGLAKTELKAVAVKQSKKLVKKAIRKGVVLAAVAGAAVVAFKNKDAIIGFVKDKIG